MFVTTPDIARQDTIEVAVMKYFPMKLLLGAWTIFVAPRNMNPVKATVRLFIPMKAKMFDWVRAAKMGLASTAPLPVMPTTVVNRSATPRRTKTEQIIVCILTMQPTSSCCVTIHSNAHVP